MNSHAVQPAEPHQHTANTARQKVKRVSMAEHQALMPNLGPRTERASVTAQPLTPIATAHVTDAQDFISHTRIAGIIDERRSKAKKKAGRPPLVPIEALLVALRLASIHNEPLLMTTVRDILCLRLTRKAQKRLGVDRLAGKNPNPENLKWRRRTARNVERAFARLLDTIDPSTDPKNRVTLWDDAIHLKKPLTDEQVKERAATLDWVCNQLLDTAYTELDPRVRARFETTAAYCIDATPLALFARGRGKDTIVKSADPDGGWYIRDSDHGDPTQGANPTDNLRNITGVRKALWARDIHLVIAADPTPGNRQYMPSLPIAFTTDRPGDDPAGAAQRIFANMQNRNQPPGWLAGDLLYTNLDDASFQSPAREAGYSLVLGYTRAQLGAQGAHHTGMVLIEGDYYCPSIPDTLKNATLDMLDLKIDRDEYDKRIRARKEFAMRVKEKTANGQPSRMQCPAAGNHPTVACPLKPRSETSRPTKQPDGAVVDTRRLIDITPVGMAGAKPKVCSCETVGVTPRDGGKFRQTLRYGTDEHTRLYNRLRQAQEGVHGSAKNEGGINLAAPGRRRVRGWAAQQIFAAFMLSKATLDRIRTFNRKAVEDDNGDLYVPRSSPAPLRNMPPGIKSSRRQPATSPPTR